MIIDLDPQGNASTGLGIAQAQRDYSSYELLRGYMQDHDLEPAGYAYEESLIEEMGTPDPDEFITRIAVPVRTGAGIP